MPFIVPVLACALGLLLAQSTISKPLKEAEPPKKTPEQKLVEAFVETCVQMTAKSS